VRPDKPVFPGDDAFRFRHLLIRDAAYDALPKATRAKLHERFATWLESHGQDLVELDEVVGYHLEQAYSYRRELGQPEEPGSGLANRASRHLAMSARRALVRGDAPAAVGLFKRATDLLPAEDSQRLKLLPSLGTALIDIGAWDEAKAVLTDAATTAQRIGEEGAAADAVVGLAFIELHTDAGTSHAKVRADLAPAIRVFEDLGDKEGLARALSIQGMLRFWRGEAARAIDELERAAQAAREAGDRSQELQNLASVVMALAYGPAPVATALEKIDKIETRTDGAHRVRVQILRGRACLESLRGRFDEARELIAEAGRSAEELGLETLRAASVLRAAGEIELLAENVAAAEMLLREASEILERSNDLGHLASVAPLHAEALLAQGRAGEAEQAIERTTQWILEDDSDAQIGLLRARAKLAAYRGDAAAAETFARQAVERASEGDDLNGHGSTLMDLAAALELTGRNEEAARAFEEALSLFERKGNVVMADRVRARLRD
jgi:tetratricopeptide (TPR) repeat protein